jgi:hypothetical protein
MWVALPMRGPPDAVHRPEATAKEELVMAATAKLALLIVGASVVAFAALFAASRAAAADVGVSPYSCIALHGGSVTRPAGSTIIVRQAFEEQTLGIERNFLNHQTTTFSLDGAPLADVSDEWSDPIQLDIGLPRPVWSSAFVRDTGIPGRQHDVQLRADTDQRRAGDLQPRDRRRARPAGLQRPGVVLAGTCTVTAS